MEVNNSSIDSLIAILNHLKKIFVSKDDVIDLMGICLVGRENLFLFGPPGTAKSAMVKELSKLLKGKTFEYLLTRFTEPNELFGPFDIRKLREGELITNTNGMLPEANLVFLDELLNANSAILNSLLMILNEKVFRRGHETKDLPVLMIVGASNHLPEDDALQALFDRFLIRVHCDYVEPSLLNDVLDSGWNLEKKELSSDINISTEEIFELQKKVVTIDIKEIRTKYIELIEKLRNAGIKISDRRAVKLQRLIASSALICKREKAILSDMWVLRYIWDTREQKEIIESIVNSIIFENNKEEKSHPRAFINNSPDPDEIYKEINNLKEKWESNNITIAEKSIIKDRLRYLTGRSDWITNQTQNLYIKEALDEFWKKIIQE
ncbi:MAG: AAA family ATPase [Cyanobacteriota bacterium]